MTRLREYSLTIDHSPFCESVIKEYCKINNLFLTPKYFTMEEFSKNSEIQKYHDELKSWDWTFGQTPSFTQKIDKISKNHKFQLVLSVNHGLISDIFSENIDSKDIGAFIDELKEKWIDSRYEDCIKHLI